MSLPDDIVNSERNEGQDRERAADEQGARHEHLQRDGNLPEQQTDRIALNAFGIRIALEGKPSIIATRGIIFLAGIGMIKLIQHEGLFDLVVRRIFKGSVVMDLVTDDRATADRFTTMIASNTLLPLLNKQLVEYSIKTDARCVQFDSVKLVYFEEIHISRDELNSLKQPGAKRIENYERELIQMTQPSTQPDQTFDVFADQKRALSPQLTSESSFKHDNQPTGSKPVQPPTNHADRVMNSYATSPISPETDIQLGLEATKYEEVKRTIDAKFAEAVERAAREASGQTQNPIDLDKNIEKVKLELSSEQGSSTSSGTFGKLRQSGHAAPAPKGNVEVEQLFPLAEKNASHDAYKKCNNADARSRYVLQHGNRVLVTGQAGMGKSTLSRDLVQKILEKQILPATELVFFIQCKDIDLNEKITLLDFLLEYCIGDGEEFTESEKRTILEMIKKCQNIVLVLDGIDEVNTSEFSSSSVPKSNLTSKLRAEVLLRCLMSGKILPHAKVLVTSRPRQAFDLAPEDRPGTIVKILGLNTTSQQELGRQICGNDCTRVFKILRQDPDLESACYVPVFCTIIYAVLHKHSQSQDRASLNTMTRVMIYLLNTYLRSAHMRDIRIEELLKICELARVGFASRKYVFEQNDIKETGIAQAAFQAFMFTYLDNDTKLKFRIFEGEHRCSFAHQIWQEFFTAIDLVFFAPQKVYETYESALMEDERWDVVSKFAFGLTNTSNKNEFKQNFAMWTHSQTNWKNRKGMLLTLAECWMPQAAKDSFSLVKLCNQIREADDQAFTLRLAKRLPHTFKIDGDQEPVTIYSNDVRSVSRLLEAAKYADNYPIKTLDFDQVEFSGDSFKLFANEISTKNIRVEELRLVSCWIGSSVVSSLIKLLPYFERIHIAYVDIPAKEVRMLKDHYARMPSARPEIYFFSQDEACDFKHDLRRKEATPTTTATTRPKQA